MLCFARDPVNTVQAKRRTSLVLAPKAHEISWLSLVRGHLSKSPSATCLSDL